MMFYARCCCLLFYMCLPVSHEATLPGGVVAARRSHREIKCRYWRARTRLRAIEWRWCKNHVRGQKIRCLKVQELLLCNQAAPGLFCWGGYRGYGSIVK